MSTWTKATSVLTVVIGRPWTLPMRWRSPSGTPIDVTGYGIAAVLKSHAGQAVILTPTLTRDDDAGGAWTFALTGTQTATVPQGQVSQLTVTLTEPGGSTHDSDWPINAVLP